ncbi:hypothetical protein K2X33_13275 [bacterium]|nr:hypothetical protein [bacterium]
MKKFFCALVISFSAQAIPTGRPFLAGECPWLISIHPDAVFMDTANRRHRKSVEVYTVGRFWSLFQPFSLEHQGLDKYVLRSNNLISRPWPLPKDLHFVYRPESLLLNYGEQFHGAVAVPYISETLVPMLYIAGSNVGFHPIGHFPLGPAGTEVASWMVIPGATMNQAIFLMRDKAGNFRLNNYGFLKNGRKAERGELETVVMLASSLPLGTGDFVLFHQSVTHSTTTVGLADITNKQLLYYNAADSTLSDGRSAGLIRWLPPSGAAALD